MFEEVKKKIASEPKVWLITGVAGFIGSNLLEELLLQGQRVVGLDNFSTGHKKNIDEVLSKFNSERVGLFNFCEGDIRDIDTCREVMNWSASGFKLPVDFVLHQAALGSVPRSIDNPINTNQNNIDGFLNMLVAARDSNVKKFVYAASSSTYGDHPGLPKKEDTIGRPLSPYAVTKYVNELYADVFAKTYGLSSIGLRYFNVFGRRQDPKGAYAAVIPKWISALKAGDDVYINGDGETSRDFCYIDNVVQANIISAVSSVVGSEVYNVAVGDRTTLNDLFHEIKHNINAHGFAYEKNPVYREFRRGDVRHSQASIDKIKSDIGYAPTHDIKQGIKEAVSWYINNK